MNKRERFLLGTIIVLALLIVHLWAGQRYLAQSQAAKTELLTLQGTLNTYQSSPSTAALITDEADWLQKNAPKPSTIQDTQSQLQNFLVSSSKSNGISPFGEKLIDLKENTGTLQKVRIQISARATENQLYNWLVQIHQPSTFRAVTYLKLTPDKNDDTQVIATLTAEQFLTLKEE